MFFAVNGICQQKQNMLSKNFLEIVHKYLYFKKLEIDFDNLKTQNIISIYISYLFIIAKSH